LIQRFLQRLFDFLNVGKPPGSTFERKGYAPELILSVGRFEWRKFPSLNLRFVAGPEERSSLKKDRCWVSWESKALVFKELLKCVLYRILI